MLSTFVASGLSLFMYPETAHAADFIASQELNSLLVPSILATAAIVGAYKFTSIFEDEFIESTTGFMEVATEPFTEGAYERRQEIAV